MTVKSTARLATAISRSIDTRLSAGIRFIRVPEVVSPLPVPEIVAQVAAQHDARFAIFAGKAPSVDPGTVVTTDVAVAIDWRNDATVTDALVILGDLERDRASGLSEVVTFQADEVRKGIFDGLVSECQVLNPPNLLIALLKALGDLRSLTDLHACADYCESLLPVDAGLVDRARAELWRLRLLPDRQTTDFDQKALRRNAELVVKLLALDATSLQRLMQHVGELGPERYEAVRLFAATSETKHLRELEFADVLASFKAVGAKQDPSTNGRTSEDYVAPPTISEIAASRSIDQDDFLEQVRELPDRNSADATITAGGQTLDWDLTNLEPVRGLLNDVDTDGTYAQTAGSIEHIADDEVHATPGTGVTQWSQYADIAKKLDLLAVRADISPKAGDLTREIEGLRAALEPYLESITAEGVRLFIGAPKLREKASRLVAASLELWTGLDELRGALAEADRSFVLEVAEQLTATDLRVIVHGADVAAYVLPLHPIVLEPRVRAAELLAANPELASDFFSLVVDSLDPAMPSLAIRFEGTSVPLGYAGITSGLLHYSRQPHQVDAVDVPQTIRQIIGRFISVHPYAELSFSLGLVSPPPRVAKALMRWLGDAGIHRARVDVYTVGDAHEVRTQLDDAMEEMISGEVENAAVRFGFSVTSLAKLAELPEKIDASEGPPHLLMFFDLAEVEQSGLGAAANSPLVGTLVSEWEFSTNPLQDSRPVIRPRSGSNELADLVNAQAGLFGSNVPSQQRSPLLSAAAERLLEQLADRATWIGTCEGMAAFVPAPRIGDLDLLGRISGTSHVAFVYSQQSALLLEPILRYLQKSTWLHPQQQDLAEFLLGTVRQAVPEGLLGFFKVRGNLSNEAVLGRLGFAAVLAYLDEERPGRLIVSLDTEGARRWLGLRDGPEMRADVLAIDLGGEQCDIEAIEIKSRTESPQWGTQPPDWLAHAIDQVTEMDRLLSQMFVGISADELTPSRREILKRQVFLEALQQWEGLRLTDQAQYEMAIAHLNALFEGKSTVTTARRVFIVSTKNTDPAHTRSVGEPPTAVTTLGVDWFKQALTATPGSDIEIPLDMLDELEGVLEDIADEANAEASAAGGAEHAAADGVDDAESAASPLDDLQAPTDGSDATGTADVGAAPDASPVARALRDAFLARRIQFKSIADDQIVVGPSVIQIPFSLQPGTRLSVLESQEDDLARDLGVESVRITNLAGRPGFAVAQLPRPNRAFPDVDSLVRPEETAYPTVALGAQLSFEPLWVALDELPHLLVGGTTGSGKSVFLRSLLRQLTHLYGPDEVDLVVIDAKGMSDYLDFASVPHVKRPDDFHSGVAGALELFAQVVEERLPARTEAFRDYAQTALQGDHPRHVTNLRTLLADADEQGTVSPLIPLVVVIDEFAELILGGPDRKRFETLVTRFNQTARAVGGHLIAATQRPSTDVVSGLMKSNFARVALRTQQKVDSRVILDENGAEALLGKGDLLYRSLDAGIVRLQGYSAVGPYRYP
jgi:hypothetical protein